MTDGGLQWRELAVDEEILYEVRDRIAIVTINRPHRRNALGWSALALFRETMRRATEDDEVLAVVITGAGGAFCAGTDLVDLTQTKSDQRGGSDAGDNAMVQSCPKPVVAAIDGPAVGLGAEIATQADVRIATDRMRIAWNFVKRWTSPRYRRRVVFAAPSDRSDGGTSLRAVG